ncbi:MAG: hypothetical protein JNL74_20605 [Fibrobacteres bacterium]|nr:hypothetical protein [Fibrobacterota bacterium]
MNSIFIILTIVLGFILILADLLFIPGGIIAITGGVFIIGAIIAAWKTLGGDAALWITVASIFISVVIVFLSVKLKLWRIFVSKDSQNREDGFVPTSNELDSYIDKKGIVVTALRPGGTVLIDGKKMDAVTEEGFVDNGQEVKVIGVSAGQLKVITVK